jgi:succinate-acetate transporter protein
MSEQQAPTQAPAQTNSVADPAPLGLAGFALTTFVLSVHNTNWAPDLIWVGLALFYGGLAQFMAGMHEFRNKNTFGATAFTTYGAFWASLATFIVLDLTHALPANFDVSKALAWFFVGFAVFNTYMLLGSARLNKAVFAVFGTLEITEIIFFIGSFFLGATHATPTELRIGTDLIRTAGYMGILTAACAWYASAAGVLNSMSERPLLKVGAPIWGGTITLAQPKPARAQAGSYNTPVPQH